MDDKKEIWRYMIAKFFLYIGTRIASIFLPREKRRKVREFYNWRYKEPDFSLARRVYRLSASFAVVKDSLESVCFGSSHGQHGFWPSEGSFNLSTISQDLYTSYELYRRVGDAKSLKRVFIFVSVFSSGFQTERTKERDMCLFFHEYWGVDYRFHKEKYFQCRRDMLYKREQQIKGVSIAGWRGEYDHEKDSTGFANTAAVGARVLSHLKNNRRSNGEIDYLDKFLDLADKLGHEAVVVIPPARSDYIALCPSNEELFSSVYALVNRHAKAKLVDLFRCPEFIDSDFGDSDHMTRVGAEKLTAIINS